MVVTVMDIEMPWRDVAGYPISLASKSTDKSLRTTLRLRIFVMFAAALTVAACVPDPGAAPKSSEGKVDINATGLEAFFQTECVDQHNATWVQARSAYLVAGCDVLWYKDDICHVEQAGHVEWNTPLTDGSAAKIEMRWPDALKPESLPKLTCEMTVQGSAGESLSTVASNIAKHLGLINEPANRVVEFDGSRSEGWIWEEAEERFPKIMLTHNFPTEGADSWQLCYSALPYERKSGWCIVM